MCVHIYIYNTHTHTHTFWGVADIGNFVKCSEAIEKRKKVIIFYGDNFYATVTLLNVFNSVDLLGSLER